MTSEAFSHPDMYPADDYSTFKTRLQAQLRQREAAHPEIHITPIESRGFLGSLALLISEKTSQKVMDKKAAAAEVRASKESTPRESIGFLGAIAVISAMGNGRLAGLAERWVTKRLARFTKQRAVFETNEAINTTFPAPPDYQARHAYTPKHRRPLLMEPGDGGEPIPAGRHRAPVGEEPSAPVPTEELQSTWYTPKLDELAASSTPRLPDDTPTVIIPPQRPPSEDAPAPQQIPRQRTGDETQEIPKVPA